MSAYFAFLEHGESELGITFAEYLLGEDTEEILAMREYLFMEAWSE